MTLPVVTCSKTPAEHEPVAKASEEKLPVSTAKVREEKLPVAVAKVPEATIPVPTTKVPEEKLPVSTAKVSEEKVPAPVAKIPDETILVPTVKLSEEKVHVPVAKASEEKVHVPVGKVPEETILVPTAKVSEEKVPIPVANVSEEKVPVPIAKVPEEIIPVPSAKVPDEQLPASVGDSSLVVGDTADGPTVDGHHVDIRAVPAVSEVPAVTEVSDENNEKSILLTAIPVSLSGEEKVSCGVAITAIEIQPTDDGTSESKASEPIVPCHTYADAVALTSLHEHEEIRSSMPQSSNEQSNNAHSEVTVDLLQADTIASNVLPDTKVSSQDESVVEKMAELCSKLEPGEEGLLSDYPDIKIEAFSVSKEETSSEKLPIIPSSNAGLSSESSTEKFAEVSGSQGQDENAVEEKAAVLKCQTEASPPCHSDLAQDIITTEPHFEMPATDVTDDGRSQGSVDLDETAKTKVSLEVGDDHQARKLHETSDSDVKTQCVSLESGHPHHETKDTSLEDNCSHPERSDIDYKRNDPFQEEKSSVQIEAHPENSETANEVNLEKSREAFEQGGTVHHEESVTAHEACDSSDEKKNSPNEISSHSQDHSDHPENSDTSIEFIKPNPEVIDSSHKHDDGHHDKCSEIQEENRSSGKTGDNEASLIDLSTNENLDSRERTDARDEQNVFSIHQQKDSNNPHECSEPCLEKDGGSHNKETGSSCGPLTLLVEVTGAAEEEEGSLHVKSESPDEKNDEYPENTNATSPDKK